MVCEKMTLIKKSGLWILILLAFVIAVNAQNIEFNSNNSYGLSLFSNTSANTQPTYERWNDTLENFTHQGGVVDLGGSNDAEWIRIKSNHEREEFMTGIISDTGNLYVQIFNGSDWIQSQTLTTSIGFVNNRRFDLAYEDHSGEGLIVYDNDTSDSTVTYRTWNGTEYSSDETYDSGLASGEFNFITLIPKKNSDEIMLTALNENSDIFAALWNGTGFNSTTTITTSAGANDGFAFDFSWEEDSGEGLIVYGVVNDDAYYRNYNTNDTWGSETLLQEVTGNGNPEPNKIRLCSDPTSDNIGIMVGDSGDDLNITIWNGTTHVTTGQPTEDESIEATASNERVQFDCAWNSTGGAIFGFIDAANANDEAISYVSYDKNGWSVSDLESALLSIDIGIGDNPLESLEFIEAPVNDDVFALTITNNANNALRTIRYLANSTWDSVFFESAEDSVCANSANCYGFDFYRYDPVPNVTNINTNVTGTNFSLNDNADFNVTVLDNINLSLVQVNFTLPNGTNTDLQTITDGDDDRVFEGTFNITDLNGAYTLRVTANDTSSHNNFNSSETLVFYVGDYLSPNVTFIEPPNSTSTSEVDSIINITVNVTDDHGLDAVIANVTLPNGTIHQLTMDNVTSKDSLPTLFEITENTTDTKGTYTIRIIANDTVNNVNDTETETFFIGDSTKPLVFELNPVNDTNFDNFTAVEVSANVTDNVDVDFVSVNITLPNGTLFELRLNNETDAELFNATFNTTDLKNYYNLTFFANDTANNINDTETTNFSIGDFTVPNDVTLNAPDDEFNTTVKSLDFNFTVLEDSLDDISCSLRVNNNIEATNATTLNNTLTNFEAINLSDNTFTWNVTCTDQFENENTSASRIFRIDTTHPNFTSLTNTPSSDDDLDPGVNVTAIANVTDDIMGVDAVILQYRPNTTSTWTNLTMNLNSGDSTFNATFNATEATTYLMRVHANDSLDNANISAEVNFTSINENTWARSPDDLGVTVSDLDENVTIGTLTINNTGDFSRTFSITSDYGETYFNDSVSDVEVAVGGLYHLIVNASRSTQGVTPIELTISADGSADPSSLITTANLVVSEDQPVLVSTFTNPNARNLSVTQGDIGVVFESELNNTGLGNASNVTFFISIPDSAGWTITSASGDDGNITSVDDPFENSTTAGESNKVVVDIPSNAATGDFDVITNSSGVNTSGTDLASLGLIFGDTITVSVGAKAAVLGATTGSAETTSSPGATGVGSATVGGIVSKAGKGETLFTTDSIVIVRGKEDDTPITVKNLFENAVMKNIHLDLEGFLAQYVTIGPQKEMHRNIDVRLGGVGEDVVFAIKGVKHHKAALNSVSENSATFTVSSDPVTLSLDVGESKEIDIDGDGGLDTEVTLREIDNGTLGLIPLINFRDLELSAFANQLNFGESVNYTMKIFAPAYLAKETYNLTLNIKSDLVALNPGLAGFTSKQVTEVRTIILSLHEIGVEEVEALFREAFSVLEEMRESGFFISEVEGLYIRAQTAFDSGDFESAGILLKHLLEIGEDAFEANKILSEIRNKIARVKSRFLSVEDTEKTFALAMQAFEEGKFGLALERAKEAQLTYILETKGTVNFVLFLSTYWWAVLLGLMVASILANLGYRRFALKIIAQRLKNLTQEEKTILKLMKEAQFKTFRKKGMSESQYHKSMYEFETRLDKIRTIRAGLRNKKARIVKTEKELSNLKKEHGEVITLLKKAQKKYLVEGKMSRDSYLREDKIEKERLAEIDEEELSLKERLEKEKYSRKYFWLSKLSKITDVLESLLDRLEGKLPAKKVPVKFLKKEVSYEERKIEETVKKKKRESKNVGFSIPHFSVGAKKTKKEMRRELREKRKKNLEKARKVHSERIARVKAERARVYKHDPKHGKLKSMERDLMPKKIDEGPPSREEVEEVFGKLKTKAPKDISKSWVGYKLDKGSKAMMMLEKFDLLHLFHKPEKEESSVMEKKENYVKRVNFKNLEVYFPIVARDLREREESKVAEENITKCMRWLFG
jgi:hypothetical protein